MKAGTEETARLSMGLQFNMKAVILVVNLLWLLLNPGTHPNPISPLNEVIKIVSYDLGHFWVMFCKVFGSWSWAVGFLSRLAINSFFLSFFFFGFLGHLCCYHARSVSVNKFLINCTNSVLGFVHLFRFRALPAFGSLYFVLKLVRWMVILIWMYTLLKTEDDGLKNDWESVCWRDVRHH